MGILYICATPIGNLEDTSIRLLKTLRQVDIIACEDTRHTVKLLNRYKIKNRLISYHEYSDKNREDYIIEQLLEGKNVALVSDAGMPAISDPGEGLVKKAIEAEIQIEIIPGPSAVISALVLSGLDTTAFVFEGFLPPKKKKRLEALERLKKETRTIILYEAPHRLPELLADIETIMGPDRRLAVCRELTKKFEEVKRGRCADIRNIFDNKVRGEICLVIEGYKDCRDKSLDQIVLEIEEMIESGIDKKEAFKMKASEYKINKSIIYRAFLEKMK